MFIKSTSNTTSILQQKCCFIDSQY